MDAAERQKSAGESLPATGKLTFRKVTGIHRPTVNRLSGVAPAESVSALDTLMGSTPTPAVE